MLICSLFSVHFEFHCECIPSSSYFNTKIDFQASLKLSQSIYCMTFVLDCITYGTYFIPLCWLNDLDMFYSCFTSLYVYQGICMHANVSSYVCNSTLFIKAVLIFHDITCLFNEV